MAKVAREVDHAHAAVMLVQRAQGLNRAVAAAIIDQDQLERPTQRLHDLYHALVKVRHRLHLIEDWRHHGEDRPAGPTQFRYLSRKPLKVCRHAAPSPCSATGWRRRDSSALTHHGTVISAKAQHPDGTPAHTRGVPQHDEMRVNALLNFRYPTTGRCR